MTFYQTELTPANNAFRQNYVVLLQGMGGVGKTELAAGFARWLDDTQGRSGGIFFTSFERGAGLSLVVNQIGRALGGERFSQLQPEQQYAVVLEYLQTNPCLLIWDNFEPVAGFPTGNEPLLPKYEQDKLKRFLKELRGGQTWVLITSRREEPWLDCGYTLINLRGLSQTDAQELAAKILLQNVGVERKNLPPEYLELLKLLGGHPLSLRVVLPHLKTQTPTQLIEALRQGLDTFKGTEEEGREKSLTVSLDYSFAKFSERTRQHLPFLALFCEQVNADWLDFFSQDSLNNPYRGVYLAVFGENLQQADWLKILDEAAAAGILEHWSGTFYKIHPALPWYLRQHLSEHHAAREVSELEKNLLDFYAEWANIFEEGLFSTPELATIVLLAEEPNLLHNLQVAQQQQDWRNAQSILQALGVIYERVGRNPEFRSLRKRVLGQVGDEFAQAKAKGQDASEFWMSLQFAEGKDLIEGSDLEGAKKIYQEMLDKLTALNDPSLNHRIAGVSHHLGIIARKQWQFAEAQAYYQKALKIEENSGDISSCAVTYHELGNIAYLQKQFKEAQEYFQKALEIFQNTEEVYRAASVYHQLGM